MALLTRADLTPTEQRLCEKAADGQLLDLRSGQAKKDNPAEGTRWDTDRCIRPQLLSQLLTGRGNLDQAFQMPVAIRVRGARILGRLNLGGLTLRCPLELYECHLGGRLDLAKAKAPNLSLRGSHLSRRLSARQLHLDNNLNLERLNCQSGVSLNGAHIGGSLDCAGAKLNGALYLLGAHIGGQLACTDATLTNTAGPALHADGLTADGDVFLRGGFTATGHSDLGALRLLGAHIGGELDCTDATLTNTAGPALAADGLTADGGVFLTGGFTATGHSDLGAVRLPGTHIGGNLDCTDATLTNTAGPALHADGLTADGNVFLRGGFTATGTGQDGAVRLPGAHIGGQLDCDSTQLTNDTGPVLDLTEATLGPLYLAPRIGTGGAWSVALSGTTYQGIPTGASLDEWLRLLRDYTPEYAAQPWQQLAAAHRAAGHERDARRILIAQQDDRRARLLRPQPGTGWPTRASLWAYRTYLGLLKLIVAYGYQTWRALIALLLILAAAGLGLLAGRIPINPTPGHPNQYVAALTKATDTATVTNQGRPCSTTEQIGLGIDLGLPLIKTNMRARCDLDTTTTPGQWITAGSWALQLLSWAAATLVIAGYTGVVRRT